MTGGFLVDKAPNAKERMTGYNVQARVHLLSLNTELTARNIIFNGDSIEYVIIHLASYHVRPPWWQSKATFTVSDKVVQQHNVDRVTGRQSCV
jgi:hypothetical protein